MTRILLGILFILSFAGCATTQKKSDRDQLQSRVVELEKKLEEKDSEIVDLQYEVKDISSKVNANAAALSSTAEVDVPVPESVSVKGGDDIIRVHAGAAKIQTALKNAGFYTGKIDGKIGAATKAAVIEFQKSQGLKSDGLVGRKTWEALKQHLK